MATPALLALLYNAALLLAMIVVFDISTNRLQWGKNLLRQLLLGAVLGSLGIGLIAASFRLEAGIVFDTRSVLLSMSGLFFGAIPTLVAMVLTAAYRLAQGGAAAVAGAMVIFATGTLGIVWRHYRRGGLESITARELYAFGVVVHVVMLSLMLTLPWETARRVLTAIALPVLLLYPAATTALGLLMVNRLSRERTTASLAESEERYRSLFENSHATMFIVDPLDGSLVDANPAASHFYGWSRDQLRQMKVSQINVLPAHAIQEHMARARATRCFHFEFQHRLADGSIRDVEVFSGPISIKGRQLLYSIVHDVTERKRAEVQVQEQIVELQRWHEATLGRETRILELKREVNRLLAAAGQPPRYGSVGSAEGLAAVGSHVSSIDDIPTGDDCRAN
jgi:PAS domain S-box-containing protein